MAAFKKIEYLNTTDGGKILRPKGQDKKPKVFQFPALQMILSFETPSDRRLLWMIAHYPYIFNFFFNIDITNISPEQVKPDSANGKALKVLHNLRMRGLIRQSKDLMKWRITLKGYLFRTTSHPGAFLIPISVAILLFGLNKISCNHAKSTVILPQSNSSTQTPNDSGMNKNSQNHFLKPPDTSARLPSKTK